MLKTYLISSLVLTLFFGAAGVSSAVKQVQRERSLAPASIDAEPVRSAVNNEIQIQTRERTMPDTAIGETATPTQDCDGTPDRDRDRLQDQTQDRDQDRLHQDEPNGIQNQGTGQAGGGNGAGNQHGNQP